MTKKPSSVAWGIICKSVLTSAGCAAIPIGLLRVPLLTKTTSKMCSDIMKAYGYDQLKGLATFFGVATGAALGVTVANEILERIPGIGTVAAMTSTSILHLSEGVLLLSVCELLKSGQITNKELEDTAWCSALSRILSSQVGSVVCRLIRGQSPFEDAYDPKRFLPAT